MGGLPRVAALGLRRPANSDFDAEYAEHTEICQAEIEASYDKITCHHETSDNEKITRTSRSSRTISLSTLGSSISRCRTLSARAAA